MSAIRSLLSCSASSGLTCPACNHSGEVAIEAFDGFPDELEVHHIGHAVRCTRCGRRGGASAHPTSRLWIAHLRYTGQRHRLPYWTPIMREAEDAAVLGAFRGEEGARYVTPGL
jgi:hypothetical protein